MKINWNIKSNDEIGEIYHEAEIQFPKIMDNVELENISSFFKGLGDETRLKIIALLWVEDMCMCEIITALGAASSTISHHLRIMEKGGIINSRREGKFTIYSLNKEKINSIMSVLFE